MIKIKSSVDCATHLYVIFKIMDKEDTSILGYQLVEALVDNIENVNDPNHRAFHIFHTHTKLIHMFPGVWVNSNTVIQVNNVYNTLEEAQKVFYSILIKQYNDEYTNLNDLRNILNGAILKVMGDRHHSSLSTAISGVEEIIARLQHADFREKYCTQFTLYERYLHNFIHHLDLGD